MQYVGGVGQVKRRQRGSILLSLPHRLVFGDDIRCCLRAVVGKAFCHVRIGQRQNLGREVAGILRTIATDGDAGNRYAARHLYRRQQGVLSFKGAAVHGYTDDRLQGKGRDRAGEMIGETSG